MKHYNPPYVRTLEVLSDAGINPLLVLVDSLGDDGYDILVLDENGKKRFVPNPPYDHPVLMTERKPWPDGLLEKVRLALASDAFDGPPENAEERRKTVKDKWK